MKGTAAGKDNAIRKGRDFQRGIRLKCRTWLLDENGAEVGDELVTVRRDSGGESGRWARAGRDILSLCLSRLKPRVPIHPL